MKAVATLCTIAVFLLLQPAVAQTPDSPKYELRSAWVATAVGLDFPPAGTASQQEARLRTIIRNMKSKGMNAVVFQVSPRGDAYYQSERLPWARRLSGTMGQDPGWDPLQVAIEESRALGMELHAWYNFGKIGDVGSADLQDSGEPRHIYFERPDLVALVGNEVWLNPGIPEAREWAIANVMEIVNNYDVDAVHFDFVRYGATAYPGDIELRDEHDPGMNLNSWRRENVSRWAMAVHDSVKAVKPWVKVGTTPLGHYQTSGGWAANLAYFQVYQDSRRWLQEGRHDYLAPQIYWGIGSANDAPQFEWLVNDWMGDTYGRHIYVGTAPYKPFVRAELPAQIDTMRAYGAHGHVHFRYDFVASGAPFADRYVSQALVPPMEWLDMTHPPAPVDFDYEWEGDVVTLTWSAGEPSAGHASSHLFALYRIQAASEPDFVAAVEDPRNLLAVTGDTVITDQPLVSDDPYYYVVRAISRNYVENVIEADFDGAIILDGRFVSTEESQPVAFRLAQNYPNPFSSTTAISFEIEAPGAVTLRIYNLLGQEVARPLDNELLPAGAGYVEWDGTSASGQPVASGTYFYSIETTGHRETRSMTIVR